MGIYLPNMEMPESCYYCPFSVGTWGYSPPDKKRCIISGKDMPIDERNVQQNIPNCPLVPVPPHGDLIDIDALMLRINIHGTNKFGMLDEDIRQFVNAAPIIITAEDGER